MEAMKLLTFACVLLLLSPLAYARGPGWSLSMPTFGDDGDSRVPFAVQVGSAFPVNLYAPDVLQDRALLVYNPSANYDLMLGTSSNFNVIDRYFLVFRNSGTFISSNHSPLWGMYEVGAQSETVRGLVEKQ